VLSVYDKNKKQFEVPDSDQFTVISESIGTILDYTDDRIDPRMGVRLGARKIIPKKSNNKFLSD
jgi:hypothetical protein